jgi:hypothetical protein
MSVTVIRYAERPELWEDSEALSRAVWPEYNQHGDVLNRYWGRLLEDFPEFQFVLYHNQDGVLAEGHTVPCAWDSGLRHLIAPVRPSLKDRYPIIPIERYVTWTRENGEPFDPWIRVHVRRGGKIARPIGHSMRITGTVAEWEQWTDLRFPDDGEYTFPTGLAPVDINHGRDLGRYWEPNVWIVHTLSERSVTTLAARLNRVRD